MRLLATVLTLVALSLVGQTQAASAKQESCKATKQGIEYYRGKTWTWERKLGLSLTQASASLQGNSLRKSNACDYLQWVWSLWRDRAKQHGRNSRALSASTSSLSTAELYFAAQWEINHGGIYSHRHGAVSSRLKEVCYELINRAFAPYGTQRWASYVIRRESDCNPAAINYTWDGWENQANGLAQMIPKYHTWIDYDRVHRDMKYAIHVFVRLSRGGRSTGPWCLCR